MLAIAIFKRHSNQLMRNIKRSEVHLKRDMICRLLGIGNVSAERIK
jgi:hypothetical protein